MLFSILDLVGVFAFAFFGARVGLQQRFNIIGVLICAFLPALGGGTIREALLHHTPVYFYDYSYGLVVIAAAIFAIATKHISRIPKLMSILDALGMATFAYLGALAAAKADLNIAGVMVFAFLTACGGGILCDILARQTPHAFRQTFYSAPPLLFGGLYWLCGGVHMAQEALVFLIIATFLLQLVSAAPKTATLLPYPRFLHKWQKQKRQLFAALTLNLRRLLRVSE